MKMVAAANHGPSIFANKKDDRVMRDGVMSSYLTLCAAFQITWNNLKQNLIPGKRVRVHRKWVCHRCSDGHFKRSCDWNGEGAKNPGASFQLCRQNEYIAPECLALKRATEEKKNG